MKRLIAAILLVASMSMTACTSINPVAVAETPTQKADALYDTFLVYKQLAVDLAQKPGTPQSVINTLARADRVVTPVMNNLQAAVLEVEAVRSEIAAGTGTEQKLIVVTNNLDRWMLEAIPALQALIDAVSNARNTAFNDTGQLTRLEWRYV